MTKGATMHGGDGERLERERRRKFWRLFFGIGGSGALAGFVFGFINGRADAAGEPISDTATAIAAVALIVSAIGGAYGTWRFFEVADEVEVADNLWAAVIGICVYALLFPIWWGLSWLGLVPHPAEWILYATVMSVTTLAYAARKWRARATD
ncbi:MAG TPA: hypothetical protein VD768_08470 [Sphingomicrobium sp.]|nr:hypothetical protein [Sphingomicrobium sp.]